MAFAQSRLYKSAAVGSHTTVTMYAYTSDDTYPEIQAPGYFKRNPRFQFRVGDIVICDCPDGLHFAKVQPDLVSVLPAYMGAVGNVLLQSEASALAQEPVGLDSALTINFGGPVGTSEDRLQILPNNCLQANVPLNNLFARIKVQVGRIGEPMEAKLYFRAVLNGTTQIGSSIYARLDDATTAFPLYFTSPLTMSAGDQICFEMVRDGAGANSGGLYTENPTISGWNDASTASILVYEAVVQ